MWDIVNYLRRTGLAHFLFKSSAFSLCYVISVPFEEMLVFAKTANG